MALVCSPCSYFPASVQSCNFQLGLHFGKCCCLSWEEILYVLHCSLDCPQGHFLLMVADYMLEFSVSTCLKLSLLELSWSHTDSTRRDFPAHLSIGKEFEVLSLGKDSLTTKDSTFSAVPVSALPCCCGLQHSRPTPGEWAALVKAYIISHYYKGHKSTLQTIMHYTHIEYYCNLVKNSNPLKSKAFLHRPHPSLLPLSPLTRTALGQNCLVPSSH